MYITYCTYCLILHVPLCIHTYIFMTICLVVTYLLPLNSGCGLLDKCTVKPSISGPPIFGLLTLLVENNPNNFYKKINILKYASHNHSNTFNEMQQKLLFIEQTLGLACTMNEGDFDCTYLHPSKFPWC